MKIIEFTGLPGIGKSTLCREIVENLRKERQVFTYRELTRPLLVRAIYRFLVYMNPFRWKYCSRLHGYCREYKNVSRGAIDVLLSLYAMADIFGKFFPNALIILDEGFVQNITSIAHLQTIIESKEFFALLSIIKSKFEIEVIDCRAKNSTVIDRLRKRGGRDRFNTIDDDNELDKYLNIKRKNIDTVSRQFSVSLHLDMDCSYEKIEQQVTQYLKRKL